MHKQGDDFSVLKTLISCTIVSKIKENIVIKCMDHILYAPNLLPPIHTTSIQLILGFLPKFNPSSRYLENNLHFLHLFLTLPGVQNLILCSIQIHTYVQRHRCTQHYTHTFLVLYSSIPKKLCKDEKILYKIEGE